MGMATIDNLLEEVARTRGKLDAIEANWKTTREYSRSLALKLMFEYEYPLLKVARLTGHQRATLRVWAQRAIADGLYAERTPYQGSWG